MAREEGGRKVTVDPPPPKFQHAGKFLQKYEILSHKFSILKNLRAKLKFLAPIISVVGNFQLSVGK